jgi:hypothetical protein
MKSRAEERRAQKRRSQLADATWRGACVCEARERLNFELSNVLLRAQRRRRNGAAVYPCLEVRAHCTETRWSRQGATAHSVSVAAPRPAKTIGGRRPREERLSTPTFRRQRKPHLHIPTEDIGRGIEAAERPRGRALDLGLVRARYHRPLSPVTFDAKPSWMIRWPPMPSPPRRATPGLAAVCPLGNQPRQSHWPLARSPLHRLSGTSLPSNPTRPPFLGSKRTFPSREHQYRVISGICGLIKSIDHVAHVEIGS